MKIFQVCAVSLLLIAGSAMAFANGIDDPKIIIKGAGGAEVKGPCPQCVDITSLKFSFQVPQGGSGTLYFTNETGKNWTSLTLIESGIPAADISCHSQLFASCTTKTLKNGEVEIILTNNSKALWRDQGIPEGGNFAISFSCVKGSCWNGGASFGGHANAGTVPEPATVALMLTGVLGLVSRRKLWINR
jgi:hypothetical protein